MRWVIGDLKRSTKKGKIDLIALKGPWSIMIRSCSKIILCVRTIVIREELSDDTVC